MKPRLLAAVYTTALAFSRLVSSASFTPLGQRVDGVSSDGYVVSNSSSRWTAGKGWETQAKDLSDNGKITIGSNWKLVAQIWSPDTGASDLGEKSDYFDYVSAITACGSVVVGNLSLLDIGL